MQLIISPIPRCKTCKHWSPYKGKEIGFGECSRWHKGYNKPLPSLASNEVLVEYDEGWGAIMGENFGCILHETMAKGDGQCLDAT